MKPPTLRKVRTLAAAPTTYGTCTACGRRSLLHAETRRCIESARIPACLRREEKAGRRAAAEVAAKLLAAMELEFGDVIND